ncbi:MULTISPECIES: MFS transporter [Bacillus]|uniref:MFS transporter n=1 Tax=Bacillus TaxID=1386 RepID=UPI000543DC69|nr:MULTISPECIES: MFS transporter [Bacillus]KWZ65779.1 ABC transporter permease [Bacillus altitudinis]HCO80039.1 MFS transporter [Bacillus sp. (in: firmicutes)]
MSLSAKNGSTHFIYLVLGQIISVFGSSLIRFVLSLHVLDMTHRVDLYALLFALSNIPLLLSPLAGAIADRFNRRNLMILFDVLTGIMILAFYFWLFSGHDSLYMIGAVMILLGVMSTFYAPAVMSSIPQLVKEEKLEQANGIVNGVQALSGVVAPIIGGVLYGLIGSQVIIGVSSIVFFLSACMLLRLNISFSPSPLAEPMTKVLLKDMKQGFSYIGSQSFLKRAMLLAALLNFILTPFFIVGGPIILRVTMKSSDIMYGIGMGIIEFAVIAGALLVGLVAKHWRIPTLYRWLLVIAVILLPVAFSTSKMALQFGTFPAYFLFLAGCLPIAMLLTMISIVVISHVQKKTPNAQLGKVMANLTMVSQCAAPLGQMMYGFLFNTFSASMYVTVLIVSALMFALAFLSKNMLRHEGESAS